MTSSMSSDSEEGLSKRSSRRRHREDKHKRKIKGSRREKEKMDKAQKHSKSKRRRDAKESPTPEIILGNIMEKFPDVLNDLETLLQMIDDGQAVDTRGMPNRSLVKNLKKLFLSLDLEEDDSGVFFLPPKIRPTLEVLGPIVSAQLRPSVQVDDTQFTEALLKDEPLGPRRRVIGPEMPSSELLAAAAKLTEAEAVLRDAEVEADDDLFIGPAPPAVVAEAASANEAERFEEVTRIMAAEIGTPYDVLGVNHKMTNDNIKKRYWKLSLMVHPDKCSHPQANQAFIKLNKAFKDLQDPEKRKATDEKIRLEEEQEKFKVELKAMREAAQWRRLQGISMEGDDELLAEIKLPPTRDEWMTTLPPERKPGGPAVTTQSTTSFSRTTKEGRGDTSIWTDTPLDKAQKAKINYLEAYNEAAALAANEDTKRTSADADLVDQYNRVKRSKSLVQKHQEEAAAASSRPKRKSKQESKKGEWEGQHPWKPWDRERDLTAGRQSVNLNAENMVEGLTSRFSSGTIQRNFL